MKLILKVLGAIVLVIVLLIAGVIALPFWPVLQDRFGGGDHRAWLDAHRTEIDLTAEVPGFRFDDSVHQARFVMLGEMHGYRAVQAIDLALVEHFASEGPARTYLAELGPDQAMAFNHYLETGDETAARGVFEAWAQINAQWANQEFFLKLQRLRDLNATLAEARRIWFVGIDRLGDAERLAALGAGRPEGAEPGFDSYAAVQALNAQLGARALEFEADASRYTHMVNHALTVAALDPERHFYGLWGLFHTSKTSVNGSRTLAMYLNDEGGAFENSVAAINTLCIAECVNMLPAQALPEPLRGDSGASYVGLPIAYDVPLLYRMRGMNDLKASMGEARVAAFRISGEGSPYVSGLRLSAVTGYLTSMLPFSYGGPAAEITDYFIAIAGSAPLTPWSGEVYDLSGLAAEAGVPGVTERLN
jgi:hypothetical protein